MQEFVSRLNAQQVATWQALRTPADIQAYLDATPYSPENANRCPLNVLRDRRAHCLDGGLFAAAALRQLGYPPLIVDLLPEPGTDDDHVLAVYRTQVGGYGALAKSNFVGLRSREPVYRTLRELVMSYFDGFFNVDGRRTLRAYTRPVNLRSFDRLDWLWDDAGADAVEKHLYGLRRIPLLPAEMATALVPVDKLTYQAGMLVANPEGLYKPKTDIS